jgi:hypothetical protein
VTSLTMAGLNGGTGPACGSPSAGSGQASLGGSHNLSRGFLGSNNLLPAGVFIKMFNTLTGFSYRGLSPHKFTPMPYVHKRVYKDALLKRRAPVTHAVLAFFCKSMMDLRIYLKGFLSTTTLGNVLIV